MSRKNITKFCAFIILICLLSLFTANCGGVFPRDSFSSEVKLNDDARKSGDYNPPRVAARLQDDAVQESSGVAASRCNEGAYWTHNDSGDDAFIYAFNLKGEKLGVWRVTGAKNDDWEDIAAYKDQSGKCFLYLGDMGNNGHDRGELTVYRVPEPQVTPGDKDSSKKDPAATEPAEAIHVKDAEFRDDAETLMVHPVTGDIYILTKSGKRESSVFKISPPFQTDKPNSMQLLGTLSVPAVPKGLLTGGDISPDGTRVAVCDYYGAYELVLPGGAKSFDEIWKQSPLVVELGERKTGESIGYSADGKFLIATSEGKNPPIILVERK